MTGWCRWSGVARSPKRIQGAELIEYDSDNHATWAANRDWLDHLERFVNGTVAPRRPPVRARSVHITTLGRFAATVDGAEVSRSTLGSRQAQQLCKRLDAARGWPVSREQLFEHLWPEAFEDVLTDLENAARDNHG